MSNKQVVLAAVVIGIIICVYYYKTVYTAVVATIAVLVPEGKTANLTCATGLVNVTKAAWMDRDGACAVTDVLSKVNGVCTGASCTYTPMTKVLGDPCRNHIKNLLMEYQCV